MLTEYHLIDSANGEWYCTILSEHDVDYWLSRYEALFPSIDFEVKVKTYG